MHVYVYDYALLGKKQHLQHITQVHLRPRCKEARCIYVSTTSDMQMRLREPRNLVILLAYFSLQAPVCIKCTCVSKWCNHLLSDYLPHHDLRTLGTFFYYLSGRLRSCSLARSLACHVINDFRTFVRMRTRQHLWKHNSQCKTPSRRATALICERTYHWLRYCLDPRIFTPALLLLFS